MSHVASHVGRNQAHFVPSRLCWSSTFVSGRQSYEAEFREHHHFDIDLAIAVAAAQLQPTMALESGETPRRMPPAPLNPPSE
jgi:hypothetical protein